MRGHGRLLPGEGRRARTSAMITNVGAAHLERLHRWRTSRAPRASCSRGWGPRLGRCCRDDPLITAQAAHVARRSAPHVRRALGGRRARARGSFPAARRAPFVLTRRRRAAWWFTCRSRARTTPRTAPPPGRGAGGRRRAGCRRGAALKTLGAAAAPIRDDGGGRPHVLDDCYNANPASMSAALPRWSRPWAAPAAGRARSPSLGDMLEVGPESEGSSRARPGGGRPPRRASSRWAPLAARSPRRALGRPAGDRRSRAAARRRRRGSRHGRRPATGSW